MVNSAINSHVQTLIIMIPALMKNQLMS